MKRSLAFVVSADMTVKAFLVKHLVAIGEKFELTVMANTNDRELLAREGISGRLQPVSIVRPINLLADLKACLELFSHFRRQHFDGIVSVTPKAGLLSMLAGFVAGIPVRIHFFTGQVWVTRHGPMRQVLKFMDRLIAWLATDILVDSETQRQFLIAEGIVSGKKSCVLASGSISGVDLQRFKPDFLAREEIRRQLSLNDDNVILLFLGRLNTDKGVLDLARAFDAIAGECPAAHLLFVGPDEGALREDIRQICALNLDRLHFVDYTPLPEKYMAAADVFCLPSYREGFGSVIIEAAAVGVPAVASRIYGLTDAVLDGKTGILHAPRKVDELSDGLKVLIASAEQRQQYALAARERVVDEFSSERVTAALLDYLNGRLEIKHEAPV